MFLDIGMHPNECFIVRKRHLSVRVSFKHCLLSIAWCVFVDENSMEIKTETDSNDITECPHDDKPSTGIMVCLVFLVLYSLHSFLRASAMLKHVIAIGLTSVRLSVCPSVRPSVRHTLAPYQNG